jgi:hypothetical protein
MHCADNARRISDDLKMGRGPGAAGYQVAPEALTHLLRHFRFVNREFDRRKHSANRSFHFDTVTNVSVEIRQIISRKSTVVPMSFAYILRCADNTFFVGLIADDLSTLKSLSKRRRDSKA